MAIEVPPPPLPDDATPEERRADIDRLENSIARTQLCTMIVIMMFVVFVLSLWVLILYGFMIK